VTQFSRVSDRVYYLNAPRSALMPSNRSAAESPGNRHDADLACWFPAVTGTGRRLAGSSSSGNRDAGPAARDWVLLLNPSSFSTFYEVPIIGLGGVHSTDSSSSRRITLALGIEHNSVCFPFVRPDFVEGRFWVNIILDHQVIASVRYLETAFASYFRCHYPGRQQRQLRAIISFHSGTPNLKPRLRSFR
jgi:hypothetical protein